MRDDEYPEPVSDPESEGLPDTADDDSTAYDDVATGREADGARPAALPSDQPTGVDRFGTTPEEARQGAPLEGRLAEEEPDVGPDDVITTASGEQVGRITEPDEGGLRDEEADAIGSDQGAAGGGASAEETAVHEIPDEAPPGLA